MPYLPERFSLEPIPNDLAPRRNPEDCERFYAITQHGGPYWDSNLPIGSSRRAILAGPVHPGWRVIRKIDGGEVLLNLKTGKMETLVPLWNQQSPEDGWNPWDVKLFLNLDIPRTAKEVKFRDGSTHPASDIGTWRPFPNKNYEVVAWR